MNVNDTYGMFDELFGDNFFRSVFQDKNSSAVGSTLPRVMREISYSAPQFPPVDVEIDGETKDLYFTFALAGYSKDEIALNFEGDCMELAAEIITKEKDKRYSLKKGIKKTSFSYKYTVPMAKYNSDMVEANFVDGLLKVKVPAREEMRPKQISIGSKIMIENKTE